LKATEDWFVEKLLRFKDILGPILPEIAGSEQRNDE